jgi:ATP-dependent DNA helicase PIF1
MEKYVLRGRVISNNNIDENDRQQFPLVVSFAMTINKSQGQTLKHVDVYLPQSIFSHGQFYFVMSRVTS